MLNLRGRKDHEREQERSGRDREDEPEEEFDFRSTKEAEGGSAKKSKSGHEGNSQRKEPKSDEHGADEARKREKAKTKTWSDVVKGLNSEDELEIANSDKSRNGSETADSVRMFDSETANQLKTMRRKGWQKRC